MNTDVFICDYCEKIFSSKYTLETHKSKAKYCLSLQQKEIKGEFNCEYCNKNFNVKKNFNNHVLICKNKANRELEKDNYILELQNENKELKEEIKRLNYQNKEIESKILKEVKNEYKIMKIKKEVSDNENCELKSRLISLEEKYNNLDKSYKELDEEYRKILKEASIDIRENIIENIRAIEKVSIEAIKNSGNKLTVNNNNSKNYIQNLLPLTDQFIKDQSKNLELKHIKGKAKSLAYFANEYSFKDRVVCTDVARRNFVFKDENDNIIKDPKGVKITKKFIENNKNVLVKLFKEFALMYYRDNCPYEYKDKVEIDECLNAIQRGDIPSNTENYSKFERIFTTYFSKLVYVKDIKEDDKDDSESEEQALLNTIEVVSSEQNINNKEDSVSIGESAKIINVELINEIESDDYEEDDEEDEFGEDPRILRQREMAMYEEAGVDFFNPFKLVNGICKH